METRKELDMQILDSPLKPEDAILDNLNPQH